MMDSYVGWHPAGDGRSTSVRPAESIPGRQRAELAPSHRSEPVEEELVALCVARLRLKSCNFVSCRELGARAGGHDSEAT